MKKKQPLNPVVAALIVSLLAIVGYFAISTLAAARNPDITGDGKVDVMDLSRLLSDWNKTGTGLATDLNDDGLVNVTDLSILLSKWGTAGTPVGYVEGWGVPTWQDEFAGTTIDTSKWTVWTQPTHGSLSFDWGVMTAANAFVKDGELHLRISRRSAPLTSGGKERWWDTAALDANGKLNTGYGRWEMRGKVTPSRDNSTGMWSAFWLRNPPDVGEIDILETWGNPVTKDGGRPSNTVDTSTLTLHESTNGTGLSTGRTWEQAAGLPSPYYTSSDYHTWTVEFTQTYFKGYFDGRLAMHATRDGAGGTEARPWIWGSTFDSATWYPRLNHAMGDPYWSPNPDPSSTTIVTPRDFIVDYVRYWRVP